MFPITQPTTITDMRRDPKGILSRLKKEKVVPILVNSKFEAAMISIEELTKLYEELQKLKHDLFVEETLESRREFERGEGVGPFETVEELMKSLKE